MQNVANTRPSTSSGEICPISSPTSSSASLSVSATTSGSASPDLLMLTRLRRPTYYGWWIVAASAGIQLLQAGLMQQAYGAYVSVLRDDMGWRLGD